MPSLEVHQLETEELDETDAEHRREAVWTRHLERLSRLTEEHPLRYLFFEVTRRCNLRCAYCGSSCDLHSGSEELDASQWIEIARQIASDFDPSRVMIAVTGGEPLIKPAIFELFTELQRLGFSYGIVTNGFYVTDRTAAELVAAGIGSISVSMDAPGEVNDRLRGSFATARAENAISCLRNAGYQGKLEIISTITRPVIPLLDTMRRRLSELRIENWRIAPVMPIGRAAEHPELIPGPVEIRQLLEYVRQARADRMNPRPQFCEEGFVGNRFEGIVRPFLAQCRAGITTGGIRANGSIGACPELGDGFAQGHIRTDRFRDVWETRYQVFRQRDWTKRGRCASCEYHSRCNGGSLHLYPTPEAELLRCLYWMAKDAEEIREAVSG